MSVPTHNTISLRYPLLAILGSLAFALPSCDSSETSSTPGGKKKEKPQANHHSAATLQIHYTRPYEPDPPQQSPNFLNNQITIISSNEIIEDAAKEAGINPEIVKEALWIEPIPDTDLITLAAYHDDKELAKRIAESVITAYVSRRNQLNLRRAKLALEALDNELVAQGDLVQEHRKELTVLIQQYGIPYFDGRSESSVGVTEEELYRHAQMKLDEFETMRDSLSIKIQTLKSTPKEAFVRTASGMDIPENGVTGPYQSYRKFTELANQKLASGLGNEHPAVIKDRQAAEQALEQARNEAVTLKEVLDTKLKLVDRQIEKMRETVSSKQDNTVDLSLKQHQYNQAKEAYEQARDMYREMKIKQQESRVMFKMPRTPITIHGWHHE